MCLGIPMQILAINGFIAHCEARGVMREVSLMLLQGESLVVNDFVMVHAGHALQKMTGQEEHSTWELLDELLSHDPNEPSA